MAKSQFLGPAYALRSLPLSAQTLINLYLEQNESGAGEPGGFYGTPGTRLLLTLDSWCCRGLYVAGGYLWAVYGSTVYRINADWTAAEIGTISTSSGPVQMTDNGVDLIIAHSGGWGRVALTGTTLSSVVNAEGTSDATFIDNYFVQAKEDGTYQWADAGTVTIDPLSFASAEGHPDYVRRTLADHRELWLFGDLSLEIAVVSGDADLPFTRTAFIEQGILAPHSAVKQDNSVFWLGRNEFGHGVVYRAQGYQPVRISTHAVEQAIATYGGPQSARAYTYQQDGHHFYVLTFAEATWCYDINAGIWHQRAYLNPATGLRERHRGECHAFFNGTHVVGDYEDGRLYALDLDTYTDDGDPIYRERTWAQIEAENKWIRFDRGELIAEMGVGLDGLDPGTTTYLTDGSGAIMTDEAGNPVIVSQTQAEVGADPQVNLQWSDDGGRTWGNYHPRSVGQIGAFRNRAVWRRMGRARTRYYRLWTSEPVRIAWRAFNLDMDVSTK